MAAPVSDVRWKRYLAKLSPPARGRVRQMRAIVRSLAPAAVPVFSYGIPAFKLNGRMLVWYAGFKGHCSMYPVPAAIRQEAARSGLKTSKGTVQFALDQPLPVALVKRFVRARIAFVRAKRERMSERG